MRIVVNDIAASNGGAMTVLRDFYRFVCEHDKENQWIFLLNDRYFPETDNVKIQTLPQIKKNRWRKLWFDFVSGRHYIRRLQPDIVLSLQNIITFGLKIPQAVCIHQAIPFQTQINFSFFKKEERKIAVIQHLIGWVIKRSAKKSDCVIVQTEWMKKAVCDQCGVPEERVHDIRPKVNSIPLGSDAAFDHKAFFYPTADAIYKNNACAIAASRMLDEKGICHSLTLTLPPEHASGSVSCVGRLPYEEVLEKYGQATLVFPSYIETFGYPLAEARQVGAIILASDTAFSREVLAGYENAYFFDPFRPEELAGLMEAVTDGAIIKKEVPTTENNPTDGWQKTMELISRLRGQG